MKKMKEKKRKSKSMLATLLWMSVMHTGERRTGRGMGGKSLYPAAVKLQKCNYKMVLVRTNNTHKSIRTARAVSSIQEKRQNGRTYRKASAPYREPSNVLNPFAHG